MTTTCIEVKLLHTLLANESIIVLKTLHFIFLDQKHIIIDPEQLLRILTGKNSKFKNYLELEYTNGSTFKTKD